LTIAGEDEFIVAGSNDSELRVWSLQSQTEVNQENDPDKPSFQVSLLVSFQAIFSF
jgi:hypothetical protein